MMIFHSKYYKFSKTEYLLPYIPVRGFAIRAHSTGLPSSDILFTDKRRKNEVITLKLDEKYNCKVFSGIEKDLEEFKAMLQIIIEN